MHILDPLLDLKTAAGAGALSIAGVAVAVRQTRLHLPQRRVPLMGLSAAFVFAAQMLQFPIGGGTSGHLIGGVLCSVLLGPSAAVLVITSVLTVQCLVFADGGVLALGANVFNMAIVNSVGGYLVYRAVRSVIPGRRGLLTGVAFASWFATVLAAVVCAGQLAAAHTVSWSIVFPAMAGVHMFIGVGEAAITTLVIVTILRTQPELIAGERTLPADGEPAAFHAMAPGSTPRRRGEFILYGLLICLGMAIFIAPFASTLPDGLESVEKRLGFQEHRNREVTVASPLSDYRVPGVGSASVATAIAGCIGTIVVFGLGWLMARILAPNAGIGAVQLATAAADSEDDREAGHA